jgi:hypothetical protein
MKDQRQELLSAIKDARTMLDQYESLLNDDVLRYIDQEQLGIFLIVPALDDNKEPATSGVTLLTDEFLIKILEVLQGITGITEDTLP